ncbi:hypothetical protein SBI_04849 [Streptomyces bingchenggensis BCW-1]|uniref:Uncharacterized protein n=1 Tax=Streptomyces bingchenggensis (strain BCW-1) TaxID=749414 RepID=D7C168_STRBB|nr:hypothetical protein SBI_04849 [Streptomyces bingchenggensis BCW-1]
MNRHADDPTADAVGASAIEPPSSNDAVNAMAEALYLACTRSHPP